jgi:hypothetical protein
VSDSSPENAANTAAKAEQGAVNPTSSRPAWVFPVCFLGTIFIVVGGVVAYLVGTAEVRMTEENAQREREAAARAGEREPRIPATVRPAQPEFVSQPWRETKPAKPDGPETVTVTPNTNTPSAGIPGNSWYDDTRRQAAQSIEEGRQHYANVEQEKARLVHEAQQNASNPALDFYNQTNAATQQHYADVAKQKQERKSKASPAPLDRPDRAGASISFADLVGGYITADDGQFLGRISTSDIEADSILNSVGEHGSDVSSKSIFNDVGRYGGNVSRLSPFNEIASAPPRVCNKDGEFAAYLTVNELKTPRVDPRALVGWLRSQ